MSGLRDYERWHEDYEDPDSDLSWRLATVRSYIRDALDRQPGQLRVLSACSGDGRDVLGVLADRADADRVTAVFLEIHPGLARRVVEAAAAGQARVEVRVTDAGTTDAYAGAVPADLVLLVGIFGNISDADLKRTIGTAPQFCSPGATLLWSRGRGRDDRHTGDRNDGDRNDEVRGWFAHVGFTELDYVTLETGSRPAVGAMRYDGSAQPLRRGERLFTFLR